MLMMKTKTGRALAFNEDDDDDDDDIYYDAVLFVCHKKSSLPPGSLL